jgi:hypothetical protein
METTDDPMNRRHHLLACISKLASSRSRTGPGEDATRGTRDTPAPAAFESGIRVALRAMQQRQHGGGHEDELETSTSTSNGLPPASTAASPEQQPTLCAGVGSSSSSSDWTLSSPSGAFVDVTNAGRARHARRSQSSTAPASRAGWQTERRLGKRVERQSVSGLASEKTKLTCWRAVTPGGCSNRPGRRARASSREAGARGPESVATSHTRDTRLLVVPYF